MPTSWDMESLPELVVMRIAAFLDVTDVLSLACTTKLFRRRTAEFLRNAKPSLLLAAKDETPDTYRVPLLTGLTIEDARAGLTIEDAPAGLTIEDAPASNKSPLWYAARYGHLSVVKYLMDVVGLTIEDARADDNSQLVG